MSKKTRKSTGGPRAAGGETGKMLDRASLYNEKVVCTVCDSNVSSQRAEKIAFDDYYFSDNPQRWRCLTCAPGSLNWLLYNPGPVSFELYLGDTSKKGGGRRDRFNSYLIEKGITEEQFYNNNEVAFRKHIIKFLKWEKESKKMSKKKSKAGSGLKPKKAVEVPASLKKHPDVGPHLKVLLSGDRSGTEAATARKALRSMGFKLSDESTWKPFLKGKRFKSDKKPKKEKAEKKETKSKGKKSTKKKDKKVDKKKGKKETKKKTPKKNPKKKKKINLEEE